MPVGRCVRRTAESVLLTCWPPAPARTGMDLNDRVDGVVLAGEELRQLERRQVRFDDADLRPQLAERVAVALVGQLQEHVRLVDALALLPPPVDRAPHGGGLAA